MNTAINETQKAIFSNISESFVLLQGIWSDTSADQVQITKSLQQIRQRVQALFQDVIEKELLLLSNDGSRNSDKKVESIEVIPDGPQKKVKSRRGRKVFENKEGASKITKKTVNKRTKRESFECPIRHILLKQSERKHCVSYQDGRSFQNWKQLHEAVASGHSYLIENMISNLGVDVNERDANGKTPLMIAAQVGSESGTRCLLRSSVKVNEKIPFSKTLDSGETALSLAFKQNHIGIVEALVQAGAKSHIVKSDHAKAHKLTAVLEAYMNGATMETAGFKFLLQANDSPDMKNEDGSTLLIMAAEKGDLATVQFMISAGADVNIFRSSKKSKDVMRRMGYNLTPLMLACKNGHISVVDALIKAGASLDLTQGTKARGFLHRFCLKNSALFFAARSGQIDIIKMLLLAGASTDFGREGNVIIAAIESDQHEALQFLIEWGLLEGQINKPRGERFSFTSPLLFAAAEGKVGAIKILVNAGFPLDLKCPQAGHDALMLASSYGHKEAVLALLEAGIGLNGPNIKNGRTLLMIACAAPKAQPIVKVLLSSHLYPKGNLNDVSPSGETALMVAVERHDLNLVKMLVKAGIDVNAQNQVGETAFILAGKAFADTTTFLPQKKLQQIFKALIQIVIFLSKAGANVNAQDISGRTALIHAVKSEKHDDKIITEMGSGFIAALLECGVDLSVRDRRGKTARGLATCFKRLLRPPFVECMTTQKRDVVLDKNI